VQVVTGSLLFEPPDVPAGHPERATAVESKRARIRDVYHYDGR
jgi:hypothetical protein